MMDTYSLTQAMTALTAAGWHPTTEHQSVDEYPDLKLHGYPEGLTYLAVTTEATEHVVEIFVSSCDCSPYDFTDGDDPDKTPGPPARGFMVVYLDAEAVDEVAEDHVVPEELALYCEFWLREFPAATHEEIAQW